jgi:hypothetical protein
MSDMVFLADALDANRSGRLSPEQVHGLETWLGAIHEGVSGLVGRQLDPLAWDVKAGKVETIEGAMTRENNPWKDGDEFNPVYRVRIANRETGNREYRAGKEIWTFVPDAAMVRAYYLRRSRRIVNVELLPDAPMADYTRRCEGVDGRPGHRLAGARQGRTSRGIGAGRVDRSADPWRGGSAVSRQPRNRPTRGH